MRPMEFSDPGRGDPLPIPVPAVDPLHMALAHQIGAAYHKAMAEAGCALQAAQIVMLTAELMGRLGAMPIMQPESQAQPGAAPEAKP